MTTYASNQPANSIMVDAQEWEELQALVKRQRVIIEKYNQVIEYYYTYDGEFSINEYSMPSEIALKEAYAAAQDTTSMTGASEK